MTDSQPLTTRRTFMTGSLAAAGTLALTPPRAAAAAAGRRVAVLGGGMGGLSAAHELAERGFQVSVYERKAWGGKCRSIPVPGTAAGGRQDLPGEHGFRFFPGFYQNLPDTMARIPLPGGGTAFDNLTTADEIVVYYGGRKLRVPADGTIAGALTPQSLLGFLQSALSIVTSVPAWELAYFAEKLLVFLTSGPERRLGQWEQMSFDAFVGAAGKSTAYREMLVDLFTGTLVAAKPDKANTRTMGLMAEAFAYSSLGLGGYQAPDRVLNAPTNEALVDPWTAYLASLGVRFHLDATVTGLDVAGGRISGARVTSAAGVTTAIDADWYVLAVPAERAVPLLSNEILALDPGLASIRQLYTDWMNGLMIFLRRPVGLADGHVAYAGGPWALTSISQAQFWPKSFSRTYGDGTVNDCLSIDISAWDRPGILYGKAAKDCTTPQIYAEVLAQIRRALPFGPLVLTDANIHSYFLDPAIEGNGTPATRTDEPLLINTTGSWHLRPEAVTAIPNLFLAADYVKSSINLATMEGANEGGRMAANGIIAASGTGGSPAVLKQLYQPGELRAVYAADDARYRAGRANAFDVIDPFVP